MANRLTFTLAGRDELSRALNGAADSADRLRLRMAGITADSDGQLRDLRGQFLSVADAEARLTDTTGNSRRAFADLSDSASKLGRELKSSLISLAPAAIPAVAGLASSAAVLAAQFGAVALAAGAYALALGPQIGAISSAVEAQGKYEDAIAASGASSDAAVKAQAEYQRQLAQLPPATREAAVAVGLLKDSYKDWSDSLSGDVMAPFTKGIAVANALIPKTTGLVKGASTQFDRLITLVGGAISTPGFDALNGRVSDFAEKTLRHGVDELTIFLAKADSGDLDNSGLSRWMDYARANGPAVWSTLENVGEATLNLLNAASGVGVGMLDLINALTGIVAAVPPGAIATLLQLAIAIKAVRLAAAGSAAAGAALRALGLQVAIMNTTAAAAPGRLAGIGSAINGLSRTAKLAVAGVGIGLLLIALSKLSASSKSTPPDVDKLTASLKAFATTGEVSGEAARAFGKDLSGLGDSLQKIADPKGLDQFQQSVISFFGTDSTPIKEAKADVDAFDKSLAGLVSSGNAKLAATALQDTIDKLDAQGKDTSKLKGQLDDYKDALAGQRVENKLAAESMGLFGDQAQKVQAKLDEQKQSADGLRQAIFALNDVNRSAFDDETKFQGAIDDATAAIKENGKTLDAHTKAGRENRNALSAIASAGEELIGSLVEQNAATSTVTAKMDEVRGAYIRAAMATGKSREEATKLAERYINMPNKTVFLKADVKDLDSKIAAGQKRVDALKQKRKVAVGADKARLDAEVRAAQTHVNNLKQKRAVQIKAIDKTAAAVWSAKHNIASVQDRTVNIQAVFTRSGDTSFGVIRRADGGLIDRYASRGPVPGFPGSGLLHGPGTSTSDSIPVLASTGEYFIKAASVQKYGVKLFDDLNAGVLPVGRRAATAGLPAAPAVASKAGGDGGQRVTYNVYPRQSVISASDLRLIQRQEEARQRVGRPG